MPFAAASCRALEHGFDRCFGDELNPLKQLGALATALFCLAAATGVVLYAILDTSVAGAYRSIEALSAQPAGSIVRSLHRYAADGFVLVTLAHLAREWSLGRFKSFRRFSWLTGVPLLPMTLAIAIVGFWLNWDRLAQYSAGATAEWLDALPFLASPLARNFLSAIDDRLFSLLVFVHLGVPLLLVFGLWMHVQRIGRPKVMPALALAVGTGATLLLLALLLPVRSQGAADLGAVPQALALDWLLLFVHPLADATSPGAVWLLAAALLTVLLVLPFLSPRMAGPPPAVDAAHCNGCRRCAEDCPYGAITMVPHPTARAGVQLASVNPLLCASCGICAGACPSATPFRGIATLATGIDMPHATVDALRRRLQHGLAAQQGAYVVFGCERGARVQTVAARRVLSVSLACTGMLPPSFIEYALRLGAAGVLVAGCRGGGCEFRLGQRWTTQRLAGEREPRLRRNVPRERWATVWADAGEEARLAAALRELQQVAPLQRSISEAPA
jgi:coenzyme F420-reducing hydrogenase delta subunit/ferredoxin